jgi:hypothetical protein
MVFLLAVPIAMTVILTCSPSRPEPGDLFPVPQSHPRASAASTMSRRHTATLLVVNILDGLQWDDPSGRMTLVFFPLQNQGSRSMGAISGEWLEGNLLGPGSPLHDVDIVVMGSAWQNIVGNPLQSCERFPPFSPPLSLFCLFLLARWNFGPCGGPVSAGWNRVLYFWGFPRDVHSPSTYTRGLLAGLGRVHHLSANGDAELRGTGVA